MDLKKRLVQQREFASEELSKTNFSTTQVAAVLESIFGSDFLRIQQLEDGGKVAPSPKVMAAKPKAAVMAAKPKAAVVKQHKKKWSAKAKAIFVAPRSLAASKKVAALVSAKQCGKV